LAPDPTQADDLADAHWRVSPPVEPDPGPLGAPENDLVELRLLLDNLPSLCWLADAGGAIHWYNRRWHDYCGSTPDAMAGWGWQSVHDPLVLPTVMARWTGCIAAGVAFEMTFPLRGADGVFRPFLTRVTPVRNRNGHVVRWCGNNTDLTSQQRTEAALERSEAYVRLLLNSSAEAFYAVDRDGITTLCNATFLRMMGFAQEQDAVGRKLHDIIHHSHPDGAHYPVADCPIYLCAEHGTAAHVTDELFYRLDGTPVPVEYWARPLIVDGEHRGAICTFLDITARRAAEAARLEVEQRLRALNADLERQVVERSSERGTTWQVSPHLLSVIDLADGTFIRVNPAWTRTLGWTEHQLTASTFFGHVHPDDMAATIAIWDAVRRSEPILDFAHRYRAADGEYRWLSWVGIPEAGKVYCSARDITVEKYQAALVETRTRERDQLWKISEDLLVVADYEGRLLRVSPSWTRLLGHSEADLLAGRYNEIVHADDMPALVAALTRMRDTGRPTQFEDRVRGADGKWRRIAWTLSPDPDGRQWTGVGRDITEQRDIEEKLRQSQKMEAVGQLTGGLAHDFNNLLAGITGSLELLQLRLGQGRAQEADRYIQAAQGAAQRAAALTHRLLAFSRRQTLDPKPVDLNRLIADMEEIIRRALTPAITLAKIAPAGLWAICVDPGQLENGLLNVCINARDAMPDGGTLTIETANTVLDAHQAAECHVPEGAYVVLSVRDTGCGMTPEVIERAFDPFFTTKPIGQGTGLGLSMVYGFARQSGGHAGIDSQPGHGTAIRLVLPRYSAPAEKAEIATQPAQARLNATGETVLVVEDEPTIRMLVAEILQELGYRVLTAQDGPAAMLVLQTGARIDLLVTDVGLPGGMNGRQIADAARVSRPALKILFMTGYAETAILGAGTLAPGMHVLTKPFAMDAMAGRIRDLMEQAR
jgi:PAS domain S-box-containing protein